MIAGTALAIKTERPDVRIIVNLLLNASDDQDILILIMNRFLSLLLFIKKFKIKWTFLRNVKTHILISNLIITVVCSVCVISSFIT
jgi:hypothetical protein